MPVGFDAYKSFTKKMAWYCGNVYMANFTAGMKTVGICNLSWVMSIYPEKGYISYVLESHDNLFILSNHQQV